MFLNKICVLMCVLAYVSSVALGSPAVDEPSNKRLRFLVLQRSDIISDEEVQTTTLTSDDLDGGQTEETTVVDIDSTTATSVDDIVDTKDDVVTERVETLDESVNINFLFEPEEEISPNRTGEEQPSLDISQFPNLKIKGTHIYGRSACQCGVARSRIVNGTAAKIDDLPWTVGLSRSGMWFIGPTKPYCGGTLINNRYVITASHCVDGMAARSLKVLLNEEDTDSPLRRLVVGVESITMHPSYSRRNVDNDIALLRLTKRVDFGPSSNLVPACIPASNDNDFSSFTATVAGWGTISPGGPGSTYLRKVDVPIITNEACNSPPSMYVNKITENMLCAGFPEGGRDACQGDSGGPLIIRNEDRDTLVGVVSWGYGCAGQNAPGVYTRVARYSQWLLKNTRDGDWCGE